MKYHFFFSYSDQQKLIIDQQQHFEIIEICSNWPNCSNLTKYQFMKYERFFLIKTNKNLFKTKNSTLRLLRFAQIGRCRSSYLAQALAPAAHSLIWLQNVQKVCPFAYAPIDRHLTLLLTCRLFPRVSYALLEVCQALLFHTITRVYP